jgi:hypothetical protein
VNPHYLSRFSLKSWDTEPKPEPEPESEPQSNEEINSCGVEDEIEVEVEWVHFTKATRDELTEFHSEKVTGYFSTKYELSISKKCLSSLLMCS